MSSSAWLWTRTAGRAAFRRTAASASSESRMFYRQQRSLLLQPQIQAHAYSSVTAIPLDWVWNQVKVPKGFEKFFPKGNVPPNKKKENDKEAKGGSDDKQDKEPQKEAPQDSSSSPFGGASRQQKQQQQNQYNSNSSGDTPPPGSEMSLAALLLVVLVARQLLLDEDEAHPSREVTWKEVVPLLEQDAIEKIVVVNKQVARVLLKEGAEHSLTPGTTSSSTGSSRSSSSSTTISTPPSQGDNDWNDGTVMELEHSSDSNNTAATSRNMSAQDRHRFGMPTKTRTLHFYIGSVESLEDKLARTQQLLGRAPRDYVPLQYITETNWALELLKASPAIVMMGLLVYMMRGMGGAAGAAGRGGPGGIFQIGKSNAKKINKEEVNVSFANVAGCQEAKKEIMEFVDFLQDATRFTKLGAKIPKGALLCGPPGTGKTLLAKAVAGEASVPFYSISGSDFIEMFVGVGPSRVRDLFKEARANAPCIVFIDEIDAVGRQRGKGGFSGGNDERENTLNQLLVEMDGFAPTTGVVVLAGTNRVDILDQALTRPGRFDRQIQVDKPDLEGRKDIFLVHLKNITLEDDAEDIAGRLAGLTPGFAGADIANICNEAAIVGARRKADAVTMEDFEKATDRIIGGLESNKIMSKEERNIVAHHEAGHAIAGWFLEHADPLLKVTIIPRSSGALGFAQYLPKEVFLRTQEQIMDIVCMALAGRAAEEVFFGRVTTGASDDLKRVTQLVYSTIQVYGMNSRVGQLAFPQDPNAMPGDKPYSDATAEAMDEEARAIVDTAYQRTLALVREKKEMIEKVATTLLDKETITHDDIIDLVGPRPFEGDALYKEFVSRRRAPSNEEKVEQEEEEVAVENEDGGGLTPGLA